MQISKNVLSSRFIISVVAIICVTVLLATKVVTLDQLEALWIAIIPAMGYLTSETVVKSNNGNGVKKDE